MEHSQKNTDCYFFYYSTCLKGDACAFRHEPSALGCETMCSYWQQGNCLNEHCNFRHMELKKNRKSIPCYWETQPSGCRKPHCCFMHKNARGPAAADPINSNRNNELTSKPINQEWSNRQDDAKYDGEHRTTIDGNSTESEQGRGGSEAGSFINSPAVDPLVVNFEEESDNESLPSPTKPQFRRLHVKTLEEIKLERIQAESAAYYNYEDDAEMDESSRVSPTSLDEAHVTRNGGGSTTLERNLRARLTNRLYTQKDVTSRNDSRGGNLDFQILSLDEIRKRRRDVVQVDDGGTLNKVPKIDSIVEKETRVKTLAEIRSLREQRTGKEGAPSITDPGGFSTRLSDDPGNRESSSDENLERRLTGTSKLTTKAPPVRLRRSHNRSSSRGVVTRRDDNESQDLGTNSDSSQEAVLLASERLMGSVEANAKDRRVATARRNVEYEGEKITRFEETVTNGNSSSIVSSSNSVFDESSVEPRTGSRNALQSVGDDDFLMIDGTCFDQSTAPDDILQDIDELLND